MCACPRGRLAARLAARTAPARAPRVPAGRTQLRAPPQAQPGAVRAAWLRGREAWASGRALDCLARRCAVGRAEPGRAVRGDRCGAVRRNPAADPARRRRRGHPESAPRMAAPSFPARTGAVPPGLPAGVRSRPPARRHRRGRPCLPPVTTSPGSTARLAGTRHPRNEQDSGRRDGGPAAAARSVTARAGRRRARRAPSGLRRRAASRNAPSLRRR